MEAEIKMKGIFKKLFNSVSVNGSLRNPKVEANINNPLVNLIEYGVAYLTGEKKNENDPAFVNPCAIARAKEQRVYVDERKK